MKTKYFLSAFLSLGIASAHLAAAPQEGNATQTSGTTLNEGALIQGTGPVFLIRGGLRCGFPSMEVFLANGFEGKNVIPITDDEIAVIPEGPPMQAPLKPKPYKTPREGDLIQVVVEEEGRFHHAGTVFFIRGDVRCGIPTIEVFAAKGFKGEDVIPISEEDMNNIPVGGVLE